MTPTKALITDFIKFFSIQPVVDANESAKMTLETVHNIKQLQRPRYGLCICYKDKNNHYHQMMAIFDISITNNDNALLRQWFNDNSSASKPLTTAEFIMLLGTAIELPC